MRSNQLLPKKTDSPKKPSTAKILLRRLRPWIMVLISSAVGVWLLYVFFATGFFTVKNISIKMDQQQYVAEYEVRNSLQSVLGRSIFKVSNQDLESQLIQQYPAIMSIESHKDIPDTISLAIFERSSVGQIQGVSGWYLIDANAVIFAAQSKEWTVPKLTFNVEAIALADYILGQQLTDESLLFFIDITEQDWQSLGLRFKEAKNQKYALEILTNYMGPTLEGDLTLFFAIDKPIVDQIKLLLVILSTANAQEKVVTTVDLRFQNPVIRYR